jgi:hypothetical protein
VSLAAGRYACANHRGSLVWSDSSVAASESVYTTGTDQFRVRARGGTWFFSNAAMSKAVYLASGGNTWTSVGWDGEDGDTRPVNRRALLDKLAALPVVEYGSSAAGGMRSIGPSGGDFHAAFGYGPENGISTGDADGVLLAAVQALYDDNRQLRQEVEALKAELQRRQ